MSAYATPRRRSALVYGEHTVTLLDASDYVGEAPARAREMAGLALKTLVGGPLPIR